MVMTDQPRTRRTRLLALGAGVAVVALVVGLWAFQPWKIFTSSTIDEALPPLATEPAVPPAARGGTSGDLSGAPAPTPASTGAPQAAPRATTQPPPPPPPPPQPAVLAQSDFVDGEHATSGTAKIVQLADGSRIVRLENFATSDGPDVHVWLSDQTAGGNWHKYDDARYVKLGKLKGTHGNQNYEIPADVDLAGLRSVVIWCDRFNVAFGTAALPG